MKKIISSLAFTLILVPFCVSAAEKDASDMFPTNKEKVSYSIGLDMGSYLVKMKGKIDFEMLKQGIEDGFSEAEPKLSKEEIAAAQAEFSAALKEEQAAVLAEMKEKNAEAGQAFLDENKAKEGVTVTESGLQYEVIEQGEGPKPKAGDTVKVDYVGTLVDGSEFDSSIKRGEPAVFTVDQVIPGWSEALQLMDVGSKYRVVIPAELAYGEQGAAPVIQPNSVLVFEISLLGIEEPEKAAEEPKKE